MSALYLMAVAGEDAFRWRYRGATPSPDVFVQQFWEGTTAAYVAVDRSTQSAMGFVSLYNVNFHSNFGYMQALSTRSYIRTGLFIEAIVLAVHHWFEVWDFRKLYMEVPEFNLPQFGSAVGKFLIEEGRLRSHERFGSQLWDHIIFALYAENWRSHGSRLLRVVQEQSDGD